MLNILVDSSVIYAFYRRHIAKKMMEKMLCWTIFA